MGLSFVLNELVHVKCYQKPVHSYRSVNFSYYINYTIIIIEAWHTMPPLMCYQSYKEILLFF